MTTQVIQAIVLGALALGVMAISAWLHIKGRDGSGWGFVAFVLVISSCSKVNG